MRNDSLRRSIVAYASAGTYDPEELIRNGHVLTVNSDNNKNKRSIVRGETKIVPDIVIWKPESELRSSDRGKAILAELIETPDSFPQIEKWKILSELHLIFNLLVPTQCVAEAKVRIGSGSINNDNVHLQSYHYSTQDHMYIFNTNP
ncbi:MAG: hypothetical protein NTV24_03350 [Candidatus Woesebacteria bacterium]|nr:hypothetical protein [Candidatus Woesebacteria bacterium]